MMAISIDIAAQIRAEPNFLFDTVWDGFVGDWAVDVSPKDGRDFSDDFTDDFGGPYRFNPTGGFRAWAPLHTAILLCLMSDRRAKDEDVIPDGSGDPRGWAGDALDPSLAPLGSRLWLLRRSALSPQTEALAAAYTREALQTLIDQGAVAQFDISAVANLDQGRLELSVDAFREAPGRTVSMNFWLLWNTPQQAGQWPLDVI